MGNLVSPSADEPDNRRAPTSTAELPKERDNDAAPALGSRPNQEREPAVRHIDNRHGGEKLGAAVPPRKGAQQLPLFGIRPMSIVAKRSPISATAELLL